MFHLQNSTWETGFSRSRRDSWSHCNAYRSGLILSIVGFIYVIETFSVMIQLFKEILQRKVFKVAPIHHHLNKAMGWIHSRYALLDNQRNHDSNRNNPSVIHTQIDKVSLCRMWDFNCNNSFEKLCVHPINGLPQKAQFWKTIAVKIYFPSKEAEPYAFHFHTILIRVFVHHFSLQKQQK